MSYTVILLCLVCWIRTFDCLKDNYFGWELRFNGRNSDLEGRLEIRYDDQWGYVCADGFSQVEGDVVCKNMKGRLGYSFGGTRVPALEVYPVSNFSLDTAHIILEGVKCNGSEDRIFECQNNGLFNASCPSSAIVGLKCARFLTDYVRVIQKLEYTRVYIGLYDPKPERYFFRESNIDTIDKLPYWWGYFCDNQKENLQGELHCYLLDLEASRRFASENNAFYSNTDDLRECTGREANEIKCGTYDECREIKNDSVICITDESDLFVRTNIYYQQRSRFEATERAGLRLVGGNSFLDGRLEVSRDGGIWGGICARLWGLGSARFACRHLGFTGVEEYGTVEGNGSYPMLKYLSCNDEHETYWYDCLHRYTRPEKVTCSSYAYVKCSAFANEGTLRLTGTAVAGEGRIEIFHDGVWGTVRNKNFPNVVCNQLGYPGSNRSLRGIEFELSDNGPVLLEIIDCEGSEASLLDCVHRWYKHSEIYNARADTRCNRPGNFTPRLYNGTSFYEGRLELWEGNQWRRVCNSTIGKGEAEVICRQLGHKSLETFYNWPKFGNGINPVLSWSFSCDHMVTFLNQCDYSYLASRKLDCDSVAVKCLKKERSAETETGTDVRVVLGVVFVLLGFVVVLGLVFFMLKRKRMRMNGPTEDRHGRQIPPDYSSVQATSPGVSNSEQNFDRPGESPPPSYENLFVVGHSEVSVESVSGNQVGNTSI